MQRVTVTGDGRHPNWVTGTITIAVEELCGTLTAGLRDTRPRTLAGLRDTVAGLLEAGGYQHERLVGLGPGDRADFLTADGIAVDLASGTGTAAAVHRQVIRHAGHHQVTAVLVVTARQALHGILPVDVDGKPVRLVHVKGNPR